MEMNIHGCAGERSVIFVDHNCCFCPELPPHSHSVVDDRLREIRLPSGYSSRRLLAVVEEVREKWQRVWDAAVVEDGGVFVFGQRVLMDYIFACHSLAYLIGYENMLPYDKTCLALASFWYDAEEHFPLLYLPNIGWFNNGDILWSPNIRVPPVHSDENVFVLSVGPVLEVEENMGRNG